MEETFAEQFFCDFLCNRIEKTELDLRANNARYALLEERNRILSDNIEPIMSGDRDITISGGDRLDFREFFDNETDMNGLLRAAAYKQGYFDCVKLLKFLGIL